MDDEYGYICSYVMLGNVWFKGCCFVKQGRMTLIVSRNCGFLALDLHRVEEPGKGMQGGEYKGST